MKIQKRYFKLEIPITDRLLCFFFGIIPESFVVSIEESELARIRKELAKLDASDVDIQKEVPLSFFDTDKHVVSKNFGD